MLDRRLPARLSQLSGLVRSVTGSSSGNLRGPGSDQLPSLPHGLQLIHDPGAHLLQTMPMLQQFVADLDFPSPRFGNAIFQQELQQQLSIVAIGLFLSLDELHAAIESVN
jgi:hypothetical protein